MQAYVQYAFESPRPFSDHYRHFGELIASSAPVPIRTQGDRQWRREVPGGDMAPAKSLRMNSRRLWKHLQSNDWRLLMRYNYCRDREVHVDGGEAQGLLWIVDKYIGDATGPAHSAP
jgi:hypothetical protein